MDVFLEKVRRGGGGGGGISDPKNYIADFVGFKAVYFGCLDFFQKTSIFGETVTPKLCSLFSFGPQDDILPSVTEMANKQPN